MDLFELEENVVQPVLVPFLACQIHVELLIEHVVLNDSFVKGMQFVLHII